MLRLRNLGRLRQVGLVATRYGLGYLTGRLMAEPAFRFLRWRKHPPPPDNVAADRLAAALEELGPTYVKLGQFFSMRPDIFPPVYIAALSRLHDNVAPQPGEAVRAVLAEEFQKPAAQVFRKFSSRPLAAASLAQVHEAVLADGTEVVVKIQRQGIERVVQADLDILAELATLVSRRIPETRIFRPEELVAEFRHQLTRELDFQLEAMRLERFREHFKTDPRFYIPRVYWDYTTDRVLTMEKVRGVPPQIEALVKEGISPKETALLLYQTFMREVLEFGSFHADPHPGNIYICENRVCLFDFGIVGTLTEPDREIILDVIASLLLNDIDSLMAAFYRLRLVSPEINERLFRREIADMFERYRGLPVRKIKLGQFLIDGVRLGRKFNIAFPTDLALLGKALLMVESLAATLDPEFEVLEASRPIFRKMRARRTNPKWLFSQSLRKARLAGQGMSELPGLFFSLMRKAESGNFKIHFLHEGLEGTTRELEGAINRLAWAIFAAAVVISGTMTLLNLLR